MIVERFLIMQSDDHYKAARIVARPEEIEKIRQECIRTGKYVNVFVTAELSTLQ